MIKFAILKSLLTFELLFLMSQSLFAVGTPQISGYLPRDPTVDSFDLTIVVTNVGNTALMPKEQSLVKDRLRIYLTDLSSAVGDFVPFDGGPLNNTVQFTVKTKTDVVQAANASGLTDFTYNLTVTANNTGGLNTLETTYGGGNTVHLSVMYYENGTAVTPTPVTATITVNTAIVQSAPQGLTAIGTHKSLIVTWTAPSTVTWSDNTTVNPASGIVLVAIDKAAGNISLPSYLYDPKATSDSVAPDGSCTFNPGAAEGSTCITCTTGSIHYLNTSALNGSAGGLVFSTSGTLASGRATIAGLTNGHNYYVTSFFLPGGATQSGCITGSPTANLTWSEINGENDASLSDPKCFIATVAYGSPLHKNLDTLRWFRNHVLLTTKAGTQFVKWYYKVGPHWAQVIAKYPVLITMTQGALWVPVSIITIWRMAAGGHPHILSPILVLLGLAIGVLMFRHRFIAPKKSLIAVGRRKRF